MELRFALLADYAAVDGSGKLSIVGEFNRIWATKFPTRVEQVHLVVRFDASVSETEEHQLKIKILDEDGKSVIPATPTMSMQFHAVLPGLPHRAQIIARINGIPFKKPGLYGFHVLVDNRELGVAHVVLAKRDS